MTSTSGGGDASKFVSHPGVDEIYAGMIDLALPPAAFRKGPSPTTDPPPTVQRRKALRPAASWKGPSPMPTNGGRRTSLSRRRSVGCDLTPLGPTKTPKEYNPCSNSAMWNQRIDEFLSRCGGDIDNDGEESPTWGGAPKPEEASPDPPPLHEALRRLVGEVRRENEGVDGVSTPQKGNGRENGNKKNDNGNGNSSRNNSNSECNIKKDNVVDLMRDLVLDVRLENDSDVIISSPIESNGKEKDDKSRNNGNDSSNNGNSKSSRSNSNINNNNGNTKKSKALKRRASLCAFKVSQLQQQLQGERGEPNQTLQRSSRGSSRPTRRSSTGLAPPPFHPDYQKLPGLPRIGSKLTRRASAGFTPPPPGNDAAAPFIAAGPISRWTVLPPPPPPPRRPSGEGEDTGESSPAENKAKKKMPCRSSSAAELPLFVCVPPIVAGQPAAKEPRRKSRHRTPLPRRRATVGLVPPSAPPSAGDASPRNDVPAPPPRSGSISSPSGNSIGSSAIGGARRAPNQVKEARRPKLGAQRRHSMLNFATPSLAGSPSDPGESKGTGKNAATKRDVGDKEVRKSRPSEASGRKARCGRPKYISPIRGAWPASDSRRQDFSKSDTRVDYSEWDAAMKRYRAERGGGGRALRTQEDGNDPKVKGPKASAVGRFMSVQPPVEDVAPKDSGPAPPREDAPASSLHGDFANGGASRGANRVEEARRPKVRARRRHSMLEFAPRSLAGPPFDPVESRGTDKDAARKRDAGDADDRKLGPSNASRRKARCGRLKYIGSPRGTWQASEDRRQDFSKSDTRVDYSAWDAAMERYRAEQAEEEQALHTQEDRKNPKVQGLQAAAVGRFARRCSAEDGVAQAATETARTEEFVRLWNDKVRSNEPRRRMGREARRDQEDGSSPRVAPKNSGIEEFGHGWNCKIWNDATNRMRKPNDERVASGSARSEHRQDGRKQDCKKNVSPSQQTVDMVNVMAELHNFKARASMLVRRCSMEDGVLQAALENARANEFVQGWKGKTNEVHHKPEQEKQQDDKRCLPLQRTVDMLHDVVEECAVPVALEDAKIDNFVPVWNDKNIEGKQKLDASNTSMTKSTAANTASSLSKNDASASVMSATNPHRNVLDVYVRSEADGGGGLDDSVSTLGNSIRSWEDPGTVRMYHIDIGREYSSGMSLGSLGNVRRTSSTKEVKEMNSPTGVAEYVDEGGEDPKAIQRFVVPAPRRASCCGAPRVSSSPSAAGESPATPGDARWTDRDFIAERNGFFKSRRAGSALELVRRGQLRVRHGAVAGGGGRTHPARRRRSTDCAVIDEESCRTVRGNLETRRGAPRHPRAGPHWAGETKEKDAPANDCGDERNAVLRRLLREHGAFLSDVEKRHRYQ